MDLQNFFKVLRFQGFQISTRENESYVGVDKVLGLCICSVDNLEEICDLECRSRQRNIIQFVCPDPLVSNTSYIRLVVKTFRRIVKKLLNF